MNPSRCPNCINDGCDALGTDDAIRELARRVGHVDRTVNQYEQKRKGERSFTDFAGMVPPAARGRIAA